MCSAGTCLSCRCFARRERRRVRVTSSRRLLARLLSALGLGCVKTQKFAKRRELFFSDQAKANPHTNCRDSNCGSEKRSFYRRRALLRFHTAKATSRHLRDHPAKKGRPPCGGLIEIRSDFYQTANVATGFLPRQPSRPSLESIANLVQSGPSAIIVKFTSRGTSGTNGTDRFFSKLNYHATRNKKYVRDLG